MRQHAQLRDGPSDGPVGHRLLASGIKQLEINSRLRSHTNPADQHVLDRNRPPVPEKKLRLTGGIAQHVAPTDR